MKNSDETSKKRGFRNILALGLVSFFTDVSTEMSLSVLPFFVVQELGATTAFLGIIEGLAESISYGFRMVSGVISDRLGKRKLLVFVGYALSTAVKPLFAVARSWTDALVVRVTDRAGKGVRTSPRDALLSESTSDEHLGKAFGLHRTLDQSGAIIGPLIASALLLTVGFGLREIFVISFIPGLIALVILLFFVKEAVGKGRQYGFFSDVKKILKKEFVLLLVVISVFSVGAFNYSFILLKASELGVVSALGALVYAFIQVTHTAIGIPIGALSDKIGKAPALLIGYVVFFITCVLSVLLQGNLLFAFVIAVVFGVYMGTSDTIQRALIPKYAPNDLRATAYGIYYLTVGICFLVANIVVGILWTNFNSNVAFAYGAVTSMIAIICMTSFILWDRKPKHH
jgi:MFS family permease